MFPLKNLAHKELRIYHDDPVLIIIQFMVLIPIIQLVSEFLAEPRLEMAPQTFQMDGLLREMQEIENTHLRHVPQTGRFSIQ